MTKEVKVLIVCSETKLDLSKYQDYYKIGVERGCLDLLKFFPEIDLVCCDQDSLTAAELADILPKAKKVLELAQVKDYIDGEVAIQEAQKLNPTEIILIAQGQRFDMQLSCFNFINKYNIIFLNDYTYAFLLKSGMNIVKHLKEYQYLSLFSLTSATVTITNLKYNIDNLKLKELSTNAISNEFVFSTGNIEVIAGAVIVVYSK